MPEVKLSAELRTEFGKGAARRIRREHKVPAVLYGHGTDPVHLTLPGHETLLALRQQNALLSVDVPGGAEQLALPKQIQRDPIKGLIEHVDLLVVRRGEKVTVDVQVSLVGEHHPEAVVVLERGEVGVEAEATAIPNEIEVSIEGLEPGTQILAEQLVLPSGVTLAIEPDSLIVNVTQARTAEEVEAELAEAEAEAGIEPTVDEDAAEAGEGDESAEGEDGADSPESEEN